MMGKRLQRGRNKGAIAAMLTVYESDVLTRTSSQPRVISWERKAVEIVEIRFKDVAITRDICREDFLVSIGTRIKVGKVSGFKEDVVRV